MFRRGRDANCSKPQAVRNNGYQISLLPRRHWLDLMVVRILTTVARSLVQIRYAEERVVKHVTSLKPSRKAHAALNLPLDAKKQPARSSMLVTAANINVNMHVDGARETSPIHNTPDFS
jgi:hypothetical protein